MPNKTIHSTHVRKPENNHIKVEESGHERIFAVCHVAHTQDYLLFHLFGVGGGGSGGDSIVFAVRRLVAAAETKIIFRFIRINSRSSMQCEQNVCDR